MVREHAINAVVRVVRHAKNVPVQEYIHLDWAWFIKSLRIGKMRSGGTRRNRDALLRKERGSRQKNRDAVMRTRHGCA
jgi:hypothetical protein